MMTKKVLFLHCVAEFNGIVTFDTLEPPDLKKNILHMLGLSNIFLFNFFYMYFATRPRTSLTEVHFIINSVIILVTRIITNLAI